LIFLAFHPPIAFTQVVELYELVIFDEAHKLGADRQPDFTLRRINRYRVAEALAGIQLGVPRWSLNWPSQHLLLLTATPHPRLLRVQDPFGKLVVRTGGVRIDSPALFDAAERD
jgi:superfamily II DNA or RNA helicase